MIVSVSRGGILPQNNYLDGTTTTVTKEPGVETFADTSEPKPFHVRPPPRTELPLQKVNTLSPCVLSFFFEFNPSETLAAHRDICGSSLRIGCLSPRGNKLGETIEFGRQADNAHGEK